VTRIYSHKRNEENLGLQRVSGAPSLRRKELLFVPFTADFAAPCSLRSQGFTLIRALLRVNDGEQRARSRHVVEAISRERLDAGMAENRFSGSFDSSLVVSLPRSRSGRQGMGAWTALIRFDHTKNLLRSISNFDE
jgi:hypothetical protein